MTRIGEELLALQASDGKWYPAIVVDWARQHPDSALYRALVWDDRVAAEKYRLHQARQLIALHIVNDIHDRQTISLAIDRPEGGGYRSLPEVMSSAQMRDLAVRDAITELVRWRDRHRHLDRELAGLFGVIDRLAIAPPSDQAA
jgi:hypothetical protein